MTDAAPKPPAAGIEDIAELVRRMCLAMTNVEMFGFAHPLARQDVHTAFEGLRLVFARRATPIVLSVSGRALLVDRLPLEDRNPLVSKFAGRLDELHVNSLFIEPGTTAEEFDSFYGILAKGPKVINAGGGLAALMDEAGLQHLKLRDVGYVMVTDGERVVSRDARVIEGELPAGDEELVRHMTARVLQKAEEQKWLLTELKNNPQKIADLISEGIDLAVSRQESGLAHDDGTVETLMQNIKLVGQALLQQEDATQGEGAEPVERVVMNLENELRLRSSKLMSTKVASGFLNEILGVVASYSDRVRARRISNEFLKGENTLKRAERLLKELAPEGESGADMLARLGDMLKQKGLSAADVESLIQTSKQEAAPKPRKPRRPYSKPVAEGVEKRLKDLHLAPEQQQQMVDSLSSYVEDRAREKSAEVRVELEQVTASRELRSRALDEIAWGIVLWNAEGQPEFANRAARAAAGADALPPLTDALRGALRQWTFPLRDLPESAAGLGVAEMKLLMAVARALVDASGNVYGAVLTPPA